MMRVTLKTCLTLLALPLSGCLGFGSGSKGLSLSPMETAGITALNGGLIGQDKAGRTLPSGVRTRALEAEFQALQYAPAGAPVSWTAGGYQGEVVPTQLYRVGSQDCRGYSHTFAKGGSPAIKTVGTACKTGAALWTPVA